MSQAELSGMMDNKSRNLADNRIASESVNFSSFTVCDLADEEVHFSRDASDYYYRMDKPHHATQSMATTPLGPSQPGSAAAVSHSARWSQASIHSLDTNNLNLALAGDQNKEFHHIEVPSSSDQARSSKLLHTIGNKLRRGSNYLNAPAKLLGHYLLGITIQNWSEFFNTSRMMSTPKTRHQLARRLSTNLSHFQGNYLCVSLVLVIYCILTSPLLLIAIAAYLLALYLVTVRSALGKQTRVCGYRLNLQQQYSFITMLSMPPLWIAGAPGAVFWVIGASFFVIGLHASMFMNDQVMSEQLTSSSNLRTLPCELTRRRSVGPSAYRELASPSTSRISGANYYNHYPLGLNDKHGYISMSNASTPNRHPHTNTGSSESTTGGSYVSSTISQWISFGAGGSKYVPAGDSEPASGSTLNDSIINVGRQRVPDVKIISRDYAGLGRVYEV